MEPKPRIIDIHFPLAGVSRGAGFNDLGSIRPQNARYPTPWASNVMPVGPFSSRVRGGSRPGLTIYTAGTGAVGNLLTEGGVALLTEAGEEILVDTGVAAASGYDVTKGSTTYTITGSGITGVNSQTGAITSLSATAGTLPSTETLGAVYRDRLFLGGSSAIIYASRQGDFSDWNYGADAEDVGRACLIQLAEAAEYGETVTAMIPHRDAYLLAANANELWVLQGDPLTGQLRNVSRHTGIISSRAWCKANDLVFFLAGDGLYQVSASGEGLRALSVDRLPEELADVDPATNTISMAYDHRNRGVWIFVTPATGSGTHWFYSLEPDGFWSMRFQTDHEPLRAYTAGSRVYILCADGSTRTIGGDDDDGDDIESHVLLGPFQVGSTGWFGRIQNLHATMASDSGTVTWRVVTGDTAEQAAESAKDAVALYQEEDDDYADYVAATGDFSSGRSHFVYPRVRAMWAVIWLQSTAQWAYENLNMQLSASGRWR